MAWDLKILRQKVSTVHGGEQFKKLNPCLNSIAERQMFAQLFFNQAEEAISGYLDGNTKNDDLLMMMLSPRAKGRENFIADRVKAKALIHACLQNMHCVTDTMSHVIYFSLALSDAQKESHISLIKVRDWVEKKSKYHALVAAIDELTKNDDYIYLKAIANHSKHRSIIEVELGVAFNREQPSPTFEFKPFTHKGKDFDKRPVRQFLKDEFLRQSKLIVSIGNEINGLV